MNQSSKPQTTLRLPEDLYERLKREAERKGLSVNSLLVLVLTEYVKENRVPN